MSSSVLGSCRSSTAVKASSARLFSSSSARYKQRVVILGSGWGGYNVLRGIDKKEWDVDRAFTKHLFQFHTSTREHGGWHTGISLCNRACSTICSPSGTTYYQAWCDDIDFTKKQLKCMPATRPKDAEPTQDADSPSLPLGKPFHLKYDKLIIAVGAYSQTFNVPGVKEHAHFLKDVKDARKIRTRILECFEQANQPDMSDIDRRNLLNFCIVGGGPTGVEFSAELHDLLHTDIARHYPTLAKFAKITLYDVAPSILGSFDQSLRNYTENTLAREGVSIFTSHHVERVEKGKLFIKEKGEVPFGLLVWSTGIAPNPLVNAATGVRKDKATSSLVTNNQLNVIMEDGRPNPDVWAIGDAATIEDARLPATAQVANQKAIYLVKKVNKLARDKESPAPFEFHNSGSLAYIGNWKAIYDRPSSDGSEDGFMQKETGRVAWLLWRSAYFTMTLSVRNKILVPAYWFLNWIFGRDLTRF